MLWHCTWCQEGCPGNGDRAHCRITSFIKSELFFYTSFGLPTTHLLFAELCVVLQPTRHANRWPSIYFSNPARLALRLCFPGVRQCSVNRTFKSLRDWSRIWMSLGNLPVEWDSQHVSCKEREPNCTKSLQFVLTVFVFVVCLWFRVRRLCLL